MTDTQRIEAAMDTATNEGWHLDIVQTTMRHIVATEANIDNALTEFANAKQRARDYGIDLNRAYNLAKWEQAHEQLETLL